MTTVRIRFLSAAEVRRLMPMGETIETMRKAFIRLSRGEVRVPQRMHLEIPEYNGVQLLKPVYIPAEHRAGCKIISLYPGNPARGLPTSHALMLVFDVETGTPLSVMDGNLLTALRTGAAAGLATDLLARKDAKTAVIFGAGFQGRYQLEAVAAVRRLEKALVFDRRREKAAEFAEEMSRRLKIPVEAAGKPEHLAEADIVCTATTSEEPVFDNRNLKPGAHINAVGAFQPHTREIPSETVQRARVVVDQRAACLAEAGDLLIPIREGCFSADRVAAELGELAAGTVLGRQTAEEITLFKSVGNAVQDLAAAERVLEAAEKAGTGKILEL